MVELHAERVGLRHERLEQLGQLLQPESVRLGGIHARHHGGIQHIRVHVDPEAGRVRSGKPPVTSRRTSAVSGVARRPQRRAFCRFASAKASSSESSTLSGCLATHR